MVNAELTPHFGIMDPVEVKVFAQLDCDNYGERDVGICYLDTGATNHMTGAREAFTELNTSVRGTSVLSHTW
jgi:hypothetical protein